MKKVLIELNVVRADGSVMNKDDQGALEQQISDLLRQTAHDHEYYMYGPRFFHESVWSH